MDDHLVNQPAPNPAHPSTTPTTPPSVTPCTTTPPTTASAAIPSTVRAPRPRAMARSPISRRVAGARSDDDTVLRARILGMLFAGGTVVSLVALAMPQPARVDRAVAVALALAGIPVAALAVTTGARWPRWALQAALGSGTIVVTGAVATAHGSGVGVAAAFFYLWVVLYAAHFFSTRALAAQVALIGTAYAAVQVALGGPGAAAEWVMVMGAVVVSAVVMAMVSARLRDVARADHLTGLPNRKLLDAVLTDELQRCRRQGSPLTVAMLDLDGFKAVNDHHGHEAGDRLLVATAEAWLRTLRSIDTLARYGGD
jgi:predicted signal transduction protein with EAL and GGDEF domain